MKNIVLATIYVTVAGLGAFAWSYDLGLQDAKEAAEIINQSINIPEIAVQLTNEVLNNNTGTGQNIEVVIEPIKQEVMRQIEIVFSETKPEVETLKTVTEEVSKTVRQQPTQIKRIVVNKDWSEALEIAKLYSMACGAKFDLEHFKLVYKQFSILKRQINDPIFHSLSHDLLFYFYDCVEQIRTGDEEKMLICQYNISPSSIAQGICDQILVALEQNKIILIQVNGDVGQLKEAIDHLGRHFVEKYSFYEKYIFGSL